MNFFLHSLNYAYFQTDERMEADFFIDVPSREEDSQVDEERSEKSDEDSDGDLSDDLEIMNSDDDESVALNKSVDELKDLDEAYIDKVDSSDNEGSFFLKTDLVETFKNFILSICFI